MERCYIERGRSATARLGPMIFYIAKTEFPVIHKAEIYSALSMNVVDQVGKASVRYVTNSPFSK